MKATVRCKDKDVELVAWMHDVVVGEETFRSYHTKEHQFLVVGDGCGHSFLLSLEDLTLLVGRTNSSLEVISFSRTLPATVTLANGYILRFKSVIRKDDYSLIEIQNEGDES